MKIDWHGANCSGKYCWGMRHVEATLRGQRIDVVVHSCNDPNTQWRDAALAIEHTTGARIEIRKDLSARLQRILGPKGVRLAEELPAVAVNGRHDDFDMVDRADVSGIRLADIRRCVCGKRISKFHNGIECDRKKLRDDFYATLQARQDQRDQLQLIHLQQKVVKLVRKLSQEPAKTYTIEECSKLLPYHPHINALRRLVMSGKVEGRKDGHDWLITGKGIMELIKRWIDKGRAPCQSKASRRAIGSLTEQYHGSNSRDA